MLQTKKLRLTHVNHLPQELLTAVSDWAEAWKASVSNSRLLCLTSFTQPPPSHLHRLPPVHTMELKTLRTFKIWSPSASIISSPTNALLESPTAGILSPFYLFISPHIWIFPGGSDGKASAQNAADPGLIPGSGRSPGEGNGNPLQYSCLENPMDGEAW